MSSNPGLTLPHAWHSMLLHDFRFCQRPESMIRLFVAIVQLFMALETLSFSL